MPLISSLGLGGGAGVVLELGRAELAEMDQALVWRMEILQDNG